ncbi:MAG: serine/threonine protein kinase [Deltaproteobacteria bacterium]|nr:serine/threonine protein kinase [Deltaproteobacteria bacterium]
MIDSDTLPRRFGPYVLVRHLGSGSGGNAYLARAPQSPEPVVVKTLHESLGSSSGALRRFRHEAEIAVLIESVNVVPVLDAGVVGSTPYFTMPFVSGWPLSRLLGELSSRGRALPLECAAELLGHALVGLHALHTAIEPKSGRLLGFVHRDLAPKNMMVEPKGHLRLIDLGLSRSNLKDWHTRPGALLGSLGYMAPEQARGERVDHRADLYSVGIIAFECIAGEHYFARTDRARLIQTMSSPPPPTFESRGLKFPPRLESVLSRALDPDPGRRFGSAHEMAEAMSAFRTPTGPAILREILSELMIGQVLEEEQTARASLSASVSVSVSESEEEDVTTVFATRPVEGMSLTPPPAPVLLEAAGTPSQARRATVLGESITELRGRPTLRNAGIAASIIGLGAGIILSQVLAESRHSGANVASRDAGEPLIEPSSLVAVGSSDPDAGVLDLGAEGGAAISEATLPERPPKASPARPREEARARRESRRRAAQRPARSAMSPPAAAEAPGAVAGGAFALERLTRLASSARTAHPERAAEIDALLGDVVLWAESNDPSRSAKLAEIEAKLQQIARAP